MEKIKRSESWRLNLDSLRTNELSVEVANCDGYKVTQIFNKKKQRWYVYIPKNSPVRECFGGREKMLRSHFVWLMENEEFDNIPKGRVIHHIDHDRENDDPVNLALMTYQSHDEYHGSLEGQKITRSKFKKFEKHTEESKALLREIASKRGNNNVWGGMKSKHSEETIAKMSEKSSAQNNAMYRKDLNADAMVKAFKEFGTLADVARIFDCSVSAVRERLNGYSKSTKWLSLSDEEIISELANHNNILSACARSLGAPLTSFNRRVKKIKDDKCNTLKLNL